jgi:hypothetical protein
VVISGQQRSSEAIRGHQWSSVVSRGHQRASEVIRGHQRSSEVIRGHQRSLALTWLWKAAVAETVGNLNEGVQVRARDLRRLVHARARVEERAATRIGRGRAHRERVRRAGQLVHLWGGQSSAPW